MIRNVDVQICLKVMWTELTVRQGNSCLRFEKQSTRDSRQRSTDKIISCLKADESRKKKQTILQHVGKYYCMSYSRFHLQEFQLTPHTF